MSGQAKICPVSRAGALFANIKYTAETFTEVHQCIEHRCAWWIQAHTTEPNYYIKGCAIALRAQTNSDGLVVV